MNVLIIAQYFQPDMGGASTRASNVAKGLSREGCSVTVVAAFPHYPLGNVPLHYRHRALIREKMGDINVLRVWIPALPHNSMVNRILLHMSFVVSSLFALPFVGKTNVIWAANPNLFCFFPTVAYSFVKRTLIVRNVDDLWPEVFYEMGLVRSGFIRFLLNLLAFLTYAASAAITPISPGYGHHIIERYHIDSKKIHVVEVGIELFRQPLSNEGKKTQFLTMYSGVLGVGYDFITLVKAASVLADREEFVFVVRGIGECEAELKRLIRELGLRNVILKSDFLSESRLRALLQSADAFVLPMNSRPLVDEGLPAKVFEYQAYGKPIICSSNGQAGRYLLETKSGIVVKTGDYGSLAKSIVYLKENPTIAKKMGQSGRRYVEDNLSVEKIGIKMKKVFEDVCVTRKVSLLALN